MIAVKWRIKATPSSSAPTTTLYVSGFIKSCIAVLSCKNRAGRIYKWIDYSSLKINEDDGFLAMIFAARAFEHEREVKEMNAPTDRDKWSLTPQTVNAYYHPSLNEIVFPAAILQPPFFNPNADDAVNYGAMGAIVGHEMKQGFDDKGRKFNSDGNMVDWWTEDDAKEYEKRVEVMVDQASAFEVHGQTVQRKLTCGENIADSGGILLALRALHNVKDFPSMPSIDGFTPTQRFFLSWPKLGDKTSQMNVRFNFSLSIHMDRTKCVTTFL